MSLSANIPQTLGRRIAVSPTGGHAIPWWAKQNPDGSLPGAQISRWTNVDDLRIDSLDWPESFTEPECAFVGGRIIVTDRVGGHGPVLVREYDAETLQRLFDWQYGDYKTVAGCSCQTSEGGSFFANFVTWDLPAQPQYAFDLAYRANLPPSPELVSPWAYVRVEFPNTDQGAITSPMSCVEWGGVVYLFHGFDGSGRFDLLKVKLTDLSTKHIVGFLSRGSGDVAPCLEIPYITATLDKANSRILLAYQNVHQTPTNCPGGAQPMAYPTSVVAVALPSLETSLVIALPWDTFHMQGADPVPCYNRADGLYFPSIKRTNCDTALGFYRLEGSAIYLLGTEISAGRMHSFSPDGWVIYEDPASAPPYITAKMPFNPIPVMTIDRWEVAGVLTRSVRVSWTNSLISDILEETPSLEKPVWSAVYRGMSPAIIQVDGESYFRVRRSSGVS